MRSKVKQLFDKIIEVEKKHNLIISDYIICANCKIFASDYGDGGCQCEERKWGLHVEKLNKELDRIKKEELNKNEK